VLAAYREERQVAQASAAQQGLDGVPLPVAQRWGFLQARIEETDAGLDWIERALRQAAEQHNLTSQIYGFLNRARVEIILGRYQRVTADLDEAERLARQVPADNVSALQSITQARAQLALAEGNASAALSSIEQLLKELDYPAKQLNAGLPLLLTSRSRAESM